MESTWAGDMIREARRRAGLTQRRLARRAKTSAPTIAAYESGTKSPNLATFTRLIAAAGFTLDARLVATGPFEDRPAHGRRLDAVLELAEAFPVHHGPEPTYPPMRPGR